MIRDAALSPHLRAGVCPWRLLLSLLESAPALLWEADAELRFTYLTGAALSAIGISEHSYTGRSIQDLFPPQLIPLTLYAPTITRCWAKAARSK